MDGWVDGWVLGGWLIAWKGSPLGFSPYFGKGSGIPKIPLRNGGVGRWSEIFGWGWRRGRWWSKKVTSYERWERGGGRSRGCLVRGRLAVPGRHQCQIHPFIPPLEMWLLVFGGKYNWSPKSIQVPFLVSEKKSRPSYISLEYEDEKAKICWVCKNNLCYGNFTWLIWRLIDNLSCGDMSLIKYFNIFCFAIFL